MIVIYGFKSRSGHHFMHEKPSEAWARAGYKLVNGELVRATDLRAGTGEKGGIDFQLESPGPVAELEQAPRHGTLGKKHLQEKVGQRFLVRVTSVRKHLLDEDNLCEKFVCDLLRYAGVIPGDSPATTQIQVCQKKVEPGAEEEVQIEVYRL